MEPRPVCLAAKAARGWDVMAIEGNLVEGGLLAGCVGWACYRYAAREKGDFAHCGERPKALPLEKSSLRLDFQESQGDS